jgi:hypothetical protein
MNKAIEYFEKLSEKIPECGCWIWTGAHIGDGYGAIGGIYAHRASYILYKGDISEDLWVLHRCDVRCCVNPEHLYLGTHDDNMRDAKERGRMRKAFEYRPDMRKLNSIDEPLIVELFNLGYKQRVLAKHFGVSQATIWSIIHNRPQRVRG